MNFVKLESLLGKDISIAEMKIGLEFEENIFDIKNNQIKNYSTKLNLKNKSQVINEFYGIPYKFVFIQTDRNNSIQSINIKFNSIIDFNFYEAFNEVYGVPNNILVIEKRNILSEENIKDETYGFNQFLRKSELDLREGSFEEKPLYILWKKENYQIKALLRHKQGVSEIIFTKLNSQNTN